MDKRRFAEQLCTPLYLILALACAPSTRGASGSAAAEAAPEDSDRASEVPAEFGSEADYRRRVGPVAEQLGELDVGVDTKQLVIEVRTRDSALEDMIAQQDTLTRPGSFDGLAALRRAVGMPGPATGAGLRLAGVASLLDGVNAYYQTDRRVLVFLDTSMTRLSDLDSVVAHELVHVHQDQKLERLTDYAQRHFVSSDTWQAAHMAMEGHATAVAAAWELESLGKDLTALNPAKWDEGMNVLINGEVLNLIYSAGFRLMLTEYGKKGWGALEDTFLNPPNSTEQALHPDKLRKDLPQSVSLPDLQSSEFGNLVYEDVIGEMLVYAHLLELGLQPDAAWIASTGWDGDKLRVYQNGKTSLAVAWRSVWDREVDAKQFRDALKPWVVAQHQKARLARRGNVVDLVYADVPRTLNELDAKLAAHHPKLHSPETDARSTEAEERARQRAREQQPRVSKGRWEHPRYGLSIPIPKEWQVIEINGQQVLAGPPVENFAPNLSLIVDQDLWQGNLEAYVAFNKQQVSDNPNHRWLGSKQITISGRQAALMESQAKSDNGLLYLRMIVLPAKGQYLVVSMASQNKHVKLHLPTFQAVERGIGLHE